MKNRLILFNVIVTAAALLAFFGFGILVTESQYYRQAEAFLDRCGARKPVARASQPEGQETRSTGKARNASQRNGSGSGTAASRRPRSGSAGRTAGSRNGTARKNTTNRKQGGGRRSRTPRTNYAVLGLLLAMLVLGLLFRWMGMGK